MKAILHTPPIWRPFCGTQEFLLETNQFMDPSNETRKHFLSQRSASQVRSTSSPKEALLWTIRPPRIHSKKLSSQEAFLSQVSAHKLTPRSIFCPIGSKALFSDPLPYYLVADIGFEQACFFQMGGDAASPLGIIFALSVGKHFCRTPCLITWWPTSVLNRPASSKRGGDAASPL